MNSPLGVRLSKDNNSWPLATPGIGRNSTVSIQLKTVVLAAMPTASVSTATSVKPGLFSDIRRANRKSCINVRTGTPPLRMNHSFQQSPCHQWHKAPPCASERSSDVFLSRMVPASQGQGGALFERGILPPQPDKSPRRGKTRLSH